MKTKDKVRKLRICGVCLGIVQTVEADTKGIRFTGLKPTFGKLFNIDFSKYDKVDGTMSHLTGELVLTAKGETLVKASLEFLRFIHQNPHDKRATSIVSIRNTNVAEDFEKSAKPASKVGKKTSVEAKSRMVPPKKKKRAA